MNGETNEEDQMEWRKLSIFGMCVGSVIRFHVKIA